MKTDEFVSVMHEKFPDVAKGTLREIMTTMLDEINRLAPEAENVKVGNHYFKTVTRAARKVRSPRSGELIEVPERSFLIYKKRI